MEPDFQNPGIAPDSLPAYEEIPLAPVSPRFAVYAVLKTTLFWLTATFVAWIAGATGQLANGPATWAPVTAAFLGLFFGCLSWMEARRRSYGLRRHDLIYARGLLVRRIVILPLSRVQHVETASGPLERRFDLVRLTCFTAGGLGADLVISGLETSRAEQVRHFLLSRMDRPDQGETEGHADGTG